MDTQSYGICSSQLLTSSGGHGWRLCVHAPVPHPEGIQQCCYTWLTSTSQGDAEINWSIQCYSCTKTEEMFPMFPTYERMALTQCSTYQMADLCMCTLLWFSRPTLPAVLGSKSTLEVLLVHRIFKGDKGFLLSSACFVAWIDIYQITSSFFHPWRSMADETSWKLLTVICITAIVWKLLFSKVGIK